MNIAPPCQHRTKAFAGRRDPRLKTLFKSAVEIQETAFAPRSNFKVGAAILTKDGSVYTGSNKELTINADHAEQRAINAALMGGQAPKDMIAVAVFGARGEITDENFEKRIPACGNCRQALHELNPDMLVVGADGVGRVQSHIIKDELPDAYYREKMLPSPPAAIATGEALVDGALHGRSKSFVPRSKNPVGAAVETDKGIFVGTRAEVSSFTSQAARMALGAALEAGATVFHRMAIIGGSNPDKLEKPADLPFDSFEALYKLAPEAEVLLPNSEGEMVAYGADQFPEFLQV